MGLGGIAHLWGGGRLHQCGGQAEDADATSRGSGPSVARSRRGPGLVPEEIGRYEETLSVFEKLASENERLRAPAAEVRTAWESDLKPLLAGIHTVDADEAGALLEEIEFLAPAQAARIDRLVLLLEENVRNDSRRLAFYHSAVIGVSLALGAWAVILARQKITTPSGAWSRRRARSPAGRTIGASPWPPPMRWGFWAGPSTTWPRESRRGRER